MKDTVFGLDRKRRIHFTLASFGKVCEILKTTPGELGRTLREVKGPVSSLRMLGVLLWGALVNDEPTLTLDGALLLIGKHCRGIWRLASLKAALTKALRTFDDDMIHLGEIVGRRLPDLADSEIEIREQGGSGHEVQS